MYIKNAVEMNSVALKVLTIILFTIADCSAEHRHNLTNSLASDEPAEAVEQSWKIEGTNLCQHKDYRTYVKCLQTHRRHEAPGATSRGNNLHGGSVNCMEDCERESCRHTNTGPCTEVCYDRCLKKTKEIHHRITEYESTNCGEGEGCDGSRKSSSPTREIIPAIANLTTSIDIRNYLNNTNVIMHANPKIEDADEKGRKNATCKSGQPGCEGNRVENPQRPMAAPSGFQPWFPAAPSLTLIPQIQMVPQVTFGLGISPNIGFGSIGGGGCPFASVWLCVPQQQQQPQQQVKDCSGCEQPYPYQRGKCDPAC